MPGEVSTTRQKRDIFFYADFNVGHLLQLAERLRGRPCTCDDSQTPKAGAYNWAIFLAFDDGVEWVFRAPSSSHAPAEAITERLLASEAATLKYVREHTTIPVPEVFAAAWNWNQAGRGWFQCGQTQPVSEEGLERDVET